MTGVTVKADDKMLSVSWTAPYAGHATLTITKYVVTYQTSKTATAALGSLQTLEVTGTSATLSNLTNDIMYDVYVMAVNSAKKDAPNSVKMTGTPKAGTTTTPTTDDDTDDDTTTTTTTDDDAAAGTPPKVTINPVKKADIKATSVMVSWMAPGSGNAPLLGYALEYMKMGAASATLEEFSATTTSTTIEGLTAATMYQIRVAGRNRIGVGTWSAYTDVTTAAATTTTTTPSGGPAKVAELMVEAGDKMLAVSWTAPASSRSITHYEVRYKAATAAVWEPKAPKAAMTVTAMMTEIKPLVNGTAYLVQVRAVDSAPAMGGWSDSGSGTPMATATPTPALPLFGAFALAGGLVAASRRRLRQRHLAASPPRHLLK